MAPAAGSASAVGAITRRCAEAANAPPPLANAALLRVMPAMPDTLTPSGTLIAPLARSIVLPAKIQGTLPAIETSLQ